MNRPVVGFDSHTLQGAPENRGFLSVVQTPETAIPLGVLPLIELVTDLGFRATVSAETLFSLMHKDGMPVVCNPMQAPAPAIPDEWLGPIGDFLSDPRSWYVRGALVAAGEFVSTRARPARVTLPSTPRSLEVAVRIHDYLTHARDSLGIRNLRSPVEVSYAEIAGHHCVWSRLLDVLASDVILPHAVDLVAQLALHELPMASQCCFLAGLLDGLPVEDGDHVLVHRHAAVLRKLHHILFRTYAIAAKLDIHPMESGVHARRRVKNPHRLLVPADLPRWRKTQIISMSAVEVEAFELRHDDVIFLDGLLLRPEFEIDRGALSLASSSFLFPREVVEPDWVGSPVNFYTNAHGVL